MNKAQSPQILVVTLLSLLLVSGLRLLPAWQSLDLKSYDLLSVLNVPDLRETDILLVSIDDASFAELKTSWPWPRAWHGKLIERLNQAGAKVIAFDIVLDTPSSFGEQDDAYLANAIAQSVPVVVGAYQQHQDLAEGYQVTSIEPYNLFQEAGVYSADVGVQLDLDGILRRFPKSEYPFWSEIYYHLVGNNADLQQIDNDLVQFLGGAGTFPRVSYYRAIEAGMLPDEVFRNKIVIVGLDLLAPSEVGVGSFDRYLTPHYIFDKQPMAGFEYHANLLENYRNDLSVAPSELSNFYSLLFFTALLSALLFIGWQPVKSSLILVTLFIGLGAIVLLLLSANLYAPLMSLLIVPLFSYLAQGGYAYYREYKDRLYITRAFSQYVSPHVLDELLQDPSRLSLGGERQHVTIMFTDLAGFTNISEQLEAEQVAELLQEHLTRISQIIVDHQGTLDKYIGDAIMAFWGAPLAHENQADNALQAAIAMQKECDVIEREFAERGLPMVQMRIGIHSGDAIVGNMGSDQLFDYTCIGDSVNLAARLESINKHYGTNIMLSHSTLELLKSRYFLAKVDDVRVKGKKEPVAIYSPVDNDDEKIAIDHAFNTYQGRDWQQAVLAYRRCGNINEKYRLLSKSMIERIQLIESDHAQLNDDGSFAFDKK